MANKYELAGKVAIVTGVAGGIGQATARLLAASGADVIGWDLLRGDVAGVSYARVDVTDADSVTAAVRALGAEPRVDLLVHCAGVLGRAAPFADQDASDWSRLVDVNLLGTLRVTHAVLPHLRRRRSGRIVTFGSLAGKEGLAGLAGYSAASAGVIAFTKALGRELAADRVLVNCIAPGPIDTAMVRDLGDAAVARMTEDSPLGRLGRPEEVAQLVAWLCSDASDFNTGAVFDMSGGRARY